MHVVHVVHPARNISRTCQVIWSTGKFTPGIRLISKPRTTQVAAFLPPRSRIPAHILQWGGCFARRWGFAMCSRRWALDATLTVRRRPQTLGPPLCFRIKHILHRLRSFRARKASLAARARCLYGCY
jgi:hypothetical protein